MNDMTERSRGVGAMLPDMQRGYSQRDNYQEFLSGSHTSGLQTSKQRSSALMINSQNKALFKNSEPLLFQADVKSASRCESVTSDYLQSHPKNANVVQVSKKL